MKKIVERKKRNEKKLVEDKLYVANILRSLVKTKKTPATISYQGDILVDSFILFKRKDDFIELEAFFPYQHVPGDELHVSFVYKETIFFFDTIVLSISQNKCKAKIPEKFYSLYNRQKIRCKIDKNEKLDICIENIKLPMDIIDITTAGIAISCPENIFQEESEIKNITILLPDSSSVCLDGIVRYCRQENDHYTYGVQFKKVSWTENNTLFNFIFSKNYPDLVSTMDYSKEAVYDLFLNSGYFSIIGGDGLVESFNQMIDIHYQLKDTPQILRDVAFLRNHVLYSGASILRIYNRTFLDQHLTAKKQSKLYPLSKDELSIGVSEFLVTHPYFKHYLTYFDARSKWQSKMYVSIVNYIGDNSKALYDTTQFFEYYMDLHEECIPEGYKCNMLNNPKKFLDFAKKEFEPLYNKTYGYDARAKFELSEIKQVYEILGLYVQRKVFQVERNGEVLGYAVCEAFSEGLNLYNMLDTCYIYPVKKNTKKQDLINALLPEIIWFYKKYDKSKFHIFCDMNKKEVNQIDVAGLKYVFLLGRAMANYEGTIEYRNLIMNNSKN